MFVIVFSAFAQYEKLLSPINSRRMELEGTYFGSTGRKCLSISSSLRASVYASLCSGMSSSTCSSTARRTAGSYDKAVLKMISAFSCRGKIYLFSPERTDGQVVIVSSGECDLNW